MVIERFEQFLAKPLFLKDSTAPLCGKHVLRALPGKRLVLLAEWQNQAVVAKLFFGIKAKLRMQREVRGANYLQKAHVQSPRLLYQGHLSGEKIYVVVFSYLSGASDLLQAYETADKRQKQHLLRQLLLTLAHHHQQGLLQRDLHLQNFLYRDGQIYTLDPAQIRQKTRLSQATCLQHLALLLAQLGPCVDAWAVPLVDVYCRARHWPNQTVVKTKLQQLLWQKRKQRAQRYLRKMYRTCSDVYVSQSFRKRILCRQDKRNLLPWLQSADLLAQASTPWLKAGRSSSVARITVNDQQLVVKRYNWKGIGHALRRAFQISRASRCWKAAHLLLWCGIATPKPVAIVEERWGWLRGRAYWVTEYVAGEPLMTVWDKRKEQQEYLLQQLQAILQTLDVWRIYHGDMKASNILLASDRFYLLDLDALRGFRWFWRWRFKDKDRRRLLVNAIFQDIYVDELIQVGKISC